MNPEDVTVVVVEDSDPNRRILVQLTIKLGFQVVECQDGEVAWTALQDIKDVDRCLVISDIMMPKLDGMQLLERIRGDERLKSLRCMFVSTLADKDHIMEAKRLKADSYILKPITFEQVKDKIQKVLPEIKYKRQG